MHNRSRSNKSNGSRSSSGSGSSVSSMHTPTRRVSRAATFGGSGP
jgi:hypothetical protein